MYTYQEMFGVSSLLRSATSAIAAGRSAAPGVLTISNLLIDKFNFNPDNATGGDAPPLDRDGTAAELDAPFELPARVLGQGPGQLLVFGVGADERLHLLVRLERPSVGFLSLHELVIARRVEPLAIVPFGRPAVEVPPVNEQLRVGRPVAQRVVAAGEIAVQRGERQVAGDVLQAQVELEGLVLRLVGLSPWRAGDFQASALDS